MQLGRAPGRGAELDKVPIEPGLHVDIPAMHLHGIDAGSEGCEFVWTFAANHWGDIPYIYLDEQLPPRNVHDSPLSG